MKLFQTQLLSKERLKFISKLHLKKFRQKEKRFLIEGLNLMVECLNSLYYADNLELIIIREDVKHDRQIMNICSNAGIAEINILKNSDFKKLSDTVNSQGILGIVKLPEPKQLISKASTLKNLVVLLEGINDPGNLGTIMRNCYWFGVDELIVGKNSADVFNPKTVRSSQGAIFNLNIKDNADIRIEIEKLYKETFNIFLTDLNAEIYLDEVDFRSFKKSAIVFGNESAGISKNLLQDKNYRKIKIRSYGKCESLNVAVSTGIILNEYKKSCSG